MRKPSRYCLLAGALGLAAVPLGGAAARSLRLTLKDAIELALRANLSVLVGATRVDEAKAQASAAEPRRCLPRVNIETYANAQNRDLRAFGLSLPGVPIPSVVGPLLELRLPRVCAAKRGRPGKLPQIEGERDGDGCRQDG